jgi:hypothetical protein
LDCFSISFRFELSSKHDKTIINPVLLDKKGGNFGKSSNGFSSPKTSVWDPESWLKCSQMNHGSNVKSPVRLTAFSAKNDFFLFFLKY